MLQNGPQSKQNLCWAKGKGAVDFSTLCCVDIKNEGMTLSFNLLGVKASVSVRETDGGRETNGDCYIDSKLLLLTIPCCVIFKVPLSISSASQTEGIQPEAHCRLLCRPLPQLGAQPLDGTPVTASCD